MLPGLNWLRILEGACLSKIGRRDEALDILGEIEQTRKTDYVDGYYLSVLYESLGMRDAAFRELDRAVEENSITLCLLDVDVKMDALRQDPRFPVLRRRVFAAESFNPSGSSQTLSAQA
jgi:tetratricopeptide (TPR) repeat protein